LNTVNSQFKLIPIYIQVSQQPQFSSYTCVLHVSPISNSSLCNLLQFPTTFSLRSQYSLHHLVLKHPQNVANCDHMKQDTFTLSTIFVLL